MKYFPIAAISFMAAVMGICIWLGFSKNNSLTCELTERTITAGAQRILETYGGKRIVFTKYSNHFGTNDIEVSYPKLQEIEGIDVQKVNSLIENDIMRIFENNQLYKENNYCLHLKCEVAYFGNNIISIQYKGFDGPGILVKSYYEKALGTTIDMKSEKVLHLEDIITDFDGLSELLMEDKFEAIEIWEGEEPDKLSACLQGKDRNIFIEELQTYGSGYIENVEWYTDGSTVVIIYGNLTERYYGEYAGSKEMMAGITDPQFWERMNITAGRNLNGISFVNFNVLALFMEMNLKNGECFCMDTSAISAATTEEGAEEAKEEENKESVTEFDDIVRTQEELDMIGEMTTLRKLEISLDYDLNEKLDFSALGNLEELQELSLNFDYTAGANVDFSFISKLDKLEILYINKAEIKDLSFLSESYGLKELYLKYVDDCDLACLQQLKKMERLHVYGHIRGHENLKDMVNMKELYLEETEPFSDQWINTDLQFTENMGELKILSVVNTLVDSVEPLAQNRKLEIVTLVNTGFTDISPLWSLEHLRELNIYGAGAETVKEQAEGFCETVSADISEKVPYPFGV